MDSYETELKVAAKRLTGRALRWAQSHEPEGRRAFYSLRRMWFVARLRFLAAWRNSEIEIDIAPDVRFGRGISFEVHSNSKNVVRIGPGSVIGDRVLIVLKDGTILFGPQTEVRRDCVLSIWKGTFELSSANYLSWGTVIHCGESIRFGQKSSTAEQATIVDATHYYTEPEEFFYHNTKTTPIEIGRDSWIGSKAIVARGAKIGDYCIVAGNSLVTIEVPSGHLAAGVPAKVVRALNLPWEKSASEIARAEAAPDPADLAAARPRRRKAVAPRTKKDNGATPPSPATP